MAFVSRYSATGITAPSTDVPAYGSAWTSDAGANTYTQQLPTKSTRRGNRVGFWMTNAGGLANPSYRNSGTFATRNVGWAWAGQWGGMVGASGLGIRRILFGGGDTATISLYAATDTSGCLRLQSDNDGNTINFGQALPVPANPTVILVASGASSTYAKILGLPGVTGAQFGLNGNATYNTFYQITSGDNNGRFLGCLNALDQYSTAADITGSVDAKEAALAAEFGFTIPTLGNVVVLGDSIFGECFQGIGSHSMVCDMAAAQPQYFWKNNSRAGQTFANIDDAGSVYADLVTAAYNRPLAGPTAFIVHLGANELLAGVLTAAQMLAAAATFASHIRRDFPTSPIKFITLLPQGTTAAKNIIRTTYNAGLAAAVAPYGATVSDITDGVSAFTLPSSSNDAAVAACTAGAAYQSYDGTPTLGAGDRIHPGPTGANLLRTNAVTIAGQVVASLNSGGIRSRNYRTRNYR